MSKKDQLRKEVLRICELIRQNEDHYAKEIADDDMRNLAYWRGNFWSGDGFSTSKTAKTYRAEQNEIFPIVDTLMAALAMELPQCEYLDVRQNSGSTPSRHNDPAFAGRRLSAVLNWMADRDSMDEMVEQSVVHACLFRSGAVRKASWSPRLGRVIWRVKLPWEVSWDGNATRWEDISWISERFVLHIDDFKERIKNKTYLLQKGKSINADTYPRAIGNRDDLSWDENERLKKSGLKEYITLHEYWDLRSKKFYHIHVGTKQVLMKADAPYGNPYDCLLWHPAVGQTKGIPDVSLLAPTQKQINEQVSARREIVRRLPRRMLVDKELFDNEESWRKWSRAKTWEPAPVSRPAGGRIADYVYVTPEMPTTFDFNAHLGSAESHIRRIAGELDAGRGVAKNIRTAAEVSLLMARDEGRVGKRVRKLVKYVRSGFEKAGNIVRWAVENPEVSKINIVEIASHAQVDVDPTTLAMELITVTPRLRVLPFSPLMEDRNARRQNLVSLLGELVNSPMNETIDWKEFSREIFDLFGFRPSILKNEDQAAAERAAAEQQEAGAAAMAAPGTPTPEMLAQGGPQALPFPSPVTPTLTTGTE